MKFKNSFNIKYDIKNQSIVKKYYATSSHANLLNAVISGTSNESTLNSHIVFGAYGTGKSYLSSIISMLLSKKMDEKHIRLLASYFESVDISVSEAILNKRTKRKYIPVMLNGYEGDLDVVYNDRLFEAIQAANLSVVFPGISNKILKVISKWEKEYPTAFQAFCEHVDNHGMKLDDYVAEIKKNNKSIHQDFSNFYEKFTFGAKLNLDNRQDAVSVYEDVAKQLDKLNIGILLIHDEYGRCLEQLNQDSIRPFMAKMQNMAELANAGLENLTLIFVAHKPISQYFGSFDETIRNEFSKIEKRFGIYPIKNDYATFVKITSKYLKGFNINPPKEYVDYSIKELQIYRVFQNFLSDLEIEKGIVEGCYPLHPLTVFLLPQISRVFGQNERTLFTFLTDIDFTNDEKGVFFPHNLVDYFFLGADKKQFDTKQSRAFLDNLGNIPNYFDSSNVELAISVYKMIYVWTITESYNFSLLSTGLISFALGIEVSQIEQVLDKLSNLKMVRYSINKKNWEIIEVAPIDLEEEINKNITQINLTIDSKLDYLNDHNPFRYIYSNLYNERNEITRFARLTFVTKENYFNNLSNNHSDLEIKVLISNEKEEKDNHYDAIYNSDFASIDKIVQRLLSIEDLMKKNAIIKVYANIITDLQYERDLSLLKLSSFFNGLIQGDLSIFTTSNSVIPKSKKDLENYINESITTKFNEAPIIINDQINMFVISKTQENAIIRVLDAIMKAGKFDVLNELGDGFKPEHLIVYSINEMESTSLKKAFDEFLANNPTGDFCSLLEIFEKEPFGLRPYVAILTLFKLLMPYWNNMMLTTNESFISDITGKELFQNLIQKKSDLKYSYDSFEFENADYLQSLEVHFTDISEMTINKSLTIRVCSRLHGWFINLPLIVQQEENIGFSEKQLIKIIKMMKIDPKRAITQLIAFFTVEDILVYKENLERHFDQYLENYETRILEKYHISNKSNWLESIDPMMLKNNQFAKVIANDETFISSYKGIVEQLDIELWPISTFHMLEVTIDADYKRLFTEVKRSTVVVNGIEKYVEEVELGKKAQNMKRTLKAMIDANGKYVSKSEVEKVLLELVDEYI